MTTREKKTSVYIGSVLVFLVLLVINIRVAAGVGSPVERAIDGFVGGVVLLVAIFFALRFFQCDKTSCRGNQSCLKSPD